jgi:hypothetical protein
MAESGEFELVQPVACCSFYPLWSEDVTLKRRFFTTFLDSEDGGEQRSAVASKVTRGHSFTVQTRTQAETSYLRRRAMMHVNKVWAVPLWPYEMELTSQASSGQATLNVNTTANRELVAGSSEMVILVDTYNNLESGEVNAFDGTTITLGANLASTWPSGTKVYPVLRSTIGTVVDLEMPTLEHSKVQFEFVESFRSQRI